MSDPTIYRTPDGKLSIKECDPVFLCTRDSLEDLIRRHNEAVDELADARAQIAATEINTNTRLFDLVRYMRSELHEADLISDREYGWLVAEAPMAKGGGSPSPRRLEDYDRTRSALLELLQVVEAAFEWIDAVPQDAVLPAMPGLDRDWVYRAIDLAKRSVKPVNKP
jgi:hypothetical protein